MATKPTPTLAPAALALAASLLLSACGESNSHAAPTAAPPPPVSVAAALERKIVESEEFSGRIEAIEQVDVRARVTGYIQSVNFRHGAEVRKGDVLFVIDPRPFQAEVARAEATLANTRAQLDLSRSEVARAEALLAEQATSKREYDDAASKVRQLEAQSRSVQAALDIARLNLSYTRVTAPISGRVGKPEITAGNLVQGEGPNSPVLTNIVSYSPIYASFEADESVYLVYAKRARNGSAPLPVHIGLADEEGFPRQGALQFVDNRIDTRSGTVRMRAVVDNKDGKLTPGLYARVKLSNGTQTRPAVLVSDRAIGTDQSKRFVLVVGEDKKAQYRGVKLGRVIDGLRIVEDGLKPGELVVVNGLQRVRPGSPVTPQTVPMEEQTTGPRKDKVAVNEATPAPSASTPAGDGSTAGATKRPESIALVPAKALTQQISSK
jgi:multidrug efflux system membrane fusion protein